MPHDSLSLALAIDHALLNPTLTESEVAAGCDLAERFCVASVCVRPADVAYAAKRLAGSKVAVGTVIGFPHGATDSQIKVAEAKRALDAGAAELDVVINIGQVLSGNLPYVEYEMGGVIVATALYDAKVKIILENCYLTDDQKRALCKMAVNIGADFVKTSTGFGTGGATLEDVALMRRAVEDKIAVKAAGGISDTATALAFLDAGCARIGCSATEAILTGLPKNA